MQPVPKAVHRSGCCDRYNWLQPLTPQSVMLTLNCCDLPRQASVNNLPKVDAQQHRGRELNSQPANCKSIALATRLLSHPISALDNCRLGLVIATQCVMHKCNIFPGSTSAH